MEAIAEITLSEEVSTDVKPVIPTIYDTLITDDIDFRVETRLMNTCGSEETIHMPNHEATIRINPDGSKQPLWVVGSRYEVVDHRELIKGFAKALDKADLEADVEHCVYGNGCRIYSTFTLDKTFPIDVEGKLQARPYFTLMTSHDGSLKLGFMVGAKVDKLRYNFSKKVYGAYAKHTKGINVEATIKEISKALDAFLGEVLPMWEKMNSLEICAKQVENILEDAVKKNVMSKRRADAIAVTTCTTVFETYTAMTNEANIVTGKKGTAERAFNRNTGIGEYFRKLTSTDMSGLTSLLKTSTTEEEIK